MTDGRGVLTRTSFRLPFLLLGGLGLLAGLDAALALLGLPHVLVGARLADVHGPLMVLGFVGTVIGLERSVALGRAWGYVAPALNGLGVLATVSVLPDTVGAGLIVAGQLGGLLVYRPLFARQPAVAVAVQTLGQLMAVAAAALWLGGVPVPGLMPWLVGYLVLTILGERLELARLGALSPRDATTAQGIAVAVLLAAVVSLLAPDAGFTLLGAALLAAALWLAVKDVARHTVRSTGLPRFIAVCLLAGYVWLGVAGAVWFLGGQVEGRAYDAAAHALFLGFVISMVMAHAPVIMPAVLRRPLPYRRAFLVPAGLLHITLAFRLAVGDARDLEWAVQAGGVGNIVSVLLFVAVAIWSTLTARTTTTAPPAPSSSSTRGQESGSRRDGEGRGGEEPGSRREGGPSRERAPRRDERVSTSYGASS
ncbi:hypothetical protein SAMN05216184_10783 [Georgenia satyanarayanai]|uniref:NnrS family protein n=1 Tax=Georgenia satyanarayanai TaxID=860221 RepID=A0A2Y9AG58_9MICO|nr:hypothetical protein [Georgenia satyanarayanai]PYF99373.1 hypothetical protein A8987_10783 [Georgenia satyanarayanai]SSA43185.1 hypothetical protein SAMN05216184_10783 [Georgenia satyanarayanai]